MIGLLSALDIVVIVLYFIVVIGVGLWSSCLNRGGTTEYFLAGRTMHWIPVGASLFASNIGSGHFLGLAGAGAANGIAVSFFEFNATIALPMLGWVFLPVYLSSGVFTMPEYLRKRLGGQRIRLYIAVLSLMLYVFTKISVDLYSGALFIEQAVPGVSAYVSTFILLLISAVVTILGGLTSVMWTDFVQTIIMLFGAFWLMIASFAAIEGLPNISQYYFSAMSNTSFFNILNSLATSTITNNSTSQSNGSSDAYQTPYPYAMHLFRPIDDSELPWLGLLGSIFSAIWYWCTDQVIVQRSLAAKNLTHAKAGCLLASYLKALPLFLMVFPGMISRILFADEIACTNASVCQAVCGKQSTCTDAAFPKLVLSLMPSGARGLMMAVMLSSLVSSLTSIFNSASTIFTIDIWRRLRKQANDMEIMIVGRVFVVLLVAVSIIWLPILRSSGQLYSYIQGIQSFLGPPIAAVFIMAVLWPRANEQGSFWALMVGLAAGLARFITEYSYPPGSEKPPVIARVNFLHFGILLFFLTILVCVVVSWLTKPLSANNLHRLVFSSRFSLLPREDLDVPNADHGNHGNRGDQLNQCDHGDQCDHDDQDDHGDQLEKCDHGYQRDHGNRGDQLDQCNHGKNGNHGKHGNAVHPEAQSIGQSSGKAKFVWSRVVVKGLQWICGIESIANGKSEELAEGEQLKMSAEELVKGIMEKRSSRILVNINLILMISVSVFICGYFA